MFSPDEDDKQKKKKENDIDQLNEPEGEDDQVNPYHNELEEPPEPEDLNLGDKMNLDNGDANDNDEQPEENPFDIDAMKDKMEVDDEAEEDDKEAEGDDEQTPKVDGEDSSDDEDGETKRDEEQPKDGDGEEEQQQPEETPADSNCPGPKEDEVDETKEEEEKVADEPDVDKKQPEEDFHQSKDQATKEENAQSMPDNENKGSVDQVQNQQPSEESKQQDDMDAQDTGEDKQAIGQAENEESKSGHQGIADTKESQTKDQKPKNKDVKEKRKQGNTNEERTLGDPEQQEKKQLKTIDKLNETEAKDKEDKEDKAADEAEEYQHIKEAKPSDKTTLDNATEDQSKQIAHEDKAPEEEQLDEEQTNTDEVPPEDANNDDEQPDNVDKMQSEKLDQKSDKPSKNKEPNPETSEQADPVEVEGDKVDTHRVQRGTDTSAHCAVDLLQDTSLPLEPTAAETLDMRKLFERERLTTRLVQTTHADFDTWQTISNKMLPNARELCEHLRLILEPTKCTRLKGDYRTGRRINLKKIIPYIASQFRKDKIWLRRTKPAQRDYKITVAIDDSKSMDHNNSKQLTLEAISLVSQALTLLESGRLSIVSFGEAPQIILNHSDQFDGPKLVNALTFEQKQSRIGELLNFTRVACAEDAGGSSADNGIFENLLIVLSDGRNIFSEGTQLVRNAVKLARLQRIFVVYIIIDNPDNKYSILDMRGFSADRTTLCSYLDTFPFPYYVIVRDLGQLPLVLSDAMRQWFELVNSEQ